MAAINTEIVFSVFMVINGLVIIGAGWVLLVVSRKLIRGEVSRKSNMGMGFKIKEAYASDEAWYRINREGGKQMILPSKAVIALGVLMVLYGVLMIPLGFVIHTSFLVINIIVVVVLLVILVPACGYWIWVRQNERKRKAA
jgi:SdpI/YfhL protein family